MKLLSCVRLLETPWTAAYQAPPSTGFARQECWSGVPLPSPLASYDTVKSKLMVLASAVLLPHPPCISALQPIAWDFCFDESRLPIASLTHSLCPVSEVLCLLLRISFTHSLFESHGQGSLATVHGVAESWTQLK